MNVGRVESTRVWFGERSGLGALSRAVADGMRTLHVFGFCVALPLCAERNVFEGAGSLMACAHCMPACALFASQLHAGYNLHVLPFVCT